MRPLPPLAFLALVVVVSAASTALLAQTPRITSPPDGTVVKPGDTMTVTVKVSGGTVPSLALLTENPIGYTKVLMAPPYNFEIRIPSEISLQRYSVSALCYVGEEAKVAQILIDVERPDAPEKLAVNFRALELEVGESVCSSARATYADGIEAGVTYSTLTKWSSDSPEVATVIDGRVSAVGPGSAKISVENGGQVAVVPVTVKNAEPAGQRR